MSGIVSPDLLHHAAEAEVKPRLAGFQQRARLCMLDLRAPNGICFQLSEACIGSEMLEDMGIQSANEFVNYIPATTRDDYDIRIRGVGRNFRALGGDPGVATYYNGVYSEDSLIALTENALFDVEIRTSIFQCSFERPFRCLDMY